MDKYQYSLPLEFFSKDEESQKGLLWLPPLQKDSFTAKIDWLSGLSLSRALYLKSQSWSKELKSILEKEELSLDPSLPYNKNIVLVQLPRAFKAQMGLLIKNCNWSSPDEVFSLHLQESKSLQPDFIQSPYIWSSTPSQLLKEVQWINL